MKKVILLLLTITLSLPILAQSEKEENEPKTLFGSGELKHGGFGGVEIKLVNIPNSFGLMVGGRGGWIINSTLSIGGGGYGLVTRHINNIRIEGKEIDAYFKNGYGGLFISYINSSNEIAHFTLNALVGGGGVAYTKSWMGMDRFDNDDNLTYESSGYFIFEPGIGVELNIIKYFRVELGGSYRIITFLDMPKSGTKASDVGGYSINLAFKFGKF